MSDHDEEEVEFGLVMPFIAGAEAGGPFDDEGLAAGFEMADWDHRLSVVCDFGEVTITRLTDPRLVPQLDLVAMRYGFEIVDQEPCEGGPEIEARWCYLTMTNAIDDELEDAIDD